MARVRALAGGTASAVHAVDVVDRAGTLHPLVLRRYVRGEGPEEPRREAAALEATAPLAVPTPRLVAVGARAPCCHHATTTRRPGGRASAVDWAAPEPRAPAADVATAAQSDPAAAPEELPPWRSPGRDDHDPYWDVVAVLGGCTQADVDRFDAADTAFLLRAVSQL